MRFAVAIVQRIVRAPVERVFAVLADGWSYSDWVVGTVHMRDVEGDWPSRGSQLPHKAGRGPLSLKDPPTVVALAPPRRLKLNAGLWPFGEAVVDIRLEP